MNNKNLVTNNVIGKIETQVKQGFSRHEGEISLSLPLSISIEITKFLNK